MEKIVITGGPCSGKTTVVRELRATGGIVVPEVATILLEGGFPVPGKDLEWSEKWQAAFQTAVFALQQPLEDVYAMTTSQSLVCDRGLLDGAAYTPGGVDRFCEIHQIAEKAALHRYTCVVHLQSMAIIAPEKYGKMGNEQRFEPLERAQMLEVATLAAWANHPNRVVIDGANGISDVIKQVVAIVS